MVDVDDITMMLLMTSIARGHTIKMAHVTVFYASKELPIAVNNLKK